MKNILAIIIAFLSLPAFAAPVVVTPGGVAGYMYLPATVTSGGSGSFTDPQGIGQIQMVKIKGFNGAATTYSDYAVYPLMGGVKISGTTPCLTGCTSSNWDVGEGTITLKSSRPASFYNTDTGAQYAGCEAVLECAVYVAPNSIKKISVRPVCYDGDISTTQALTCASAFAEVPGSGDLWLKSNYVYTTGGTAIGLYAGGYLAQAVIADFTDVTGKAGVVGYNTLATSNYDGLSNTTLIMAAINSGFGTQLTDTVSGLCTSKGSGWYVPSFNELFHNIYINRVNLGANYLGLFYISSTEYDGGVGLNNVWRRDFSAAGSGGGISKANIGVTRCLKRF